MRNRKQNHWFGIWDFESI